MDSNDVRLASDLTLVLLFTLMVVVVLAMSVRALVLTVKERRAPWKRRLWMASGFLGGLCIAYGTFVEPYWLAVSEVRLSSPKLTRPVRLVQISDLHCEARPRVEERLPDVIAALHPDLICFTGDTLNSAEGLPVLRKVLSRLAGIAPTFAVAGNWDSWFWRELKPFEGTGVTVLDGQVVHCGELAIAGVGVDREARLVFKEMKPYLVFLYHYSDEIYNLAGRVDLYLAGHTHGGQVVLPFYGAVITDSKFGKRFESGLFQVGGTWLYVNRGLGVDGGAPPVRFLCRPEVTVFDLSPQPAGQPGQQRQ